MRKNYISMYARLTLTSLALLGLVAGCAEIEGNIGSRADNFNRTVADYNNEATLLNVVRASHSEPLTFVGITGTTGHNTLTGNMGLPTLTVGPDTPLTGALSPVRNYSFGPNGLSGSQSSDFNLSVPADPATYAALLTPLDIPTMSYFFELSLPPDLLLLLFVDHIIVQFDDAEKPYSFYANDAKSYDLLDANGESRPSRLTARLEPRRCTESTQDRSKCVESTEQDKSAEQDQVYCLVDPKGVCRTPALLAYSYLGLQGLTLQTERGAIPGQATRPQSRICFNPDIIPSGVLDSLAKRGLTGYIRDIIELPTKKAHAEGRRAKTVSLLNAKTTLSCNDPKAQTVWFPARALSPQAGGGAGQQSSSQPIAAAFACSTPTCPKPIINLPSTRGQNTGDCTDSDSGQRGKGPSKPCTQAFYGFHDDYDNAYIQFVPRATRAIYYFLGRLAGKPPIKLLAPYADLPADNFFNVVKGRSSDCFSVTKYRGEMYCVPNEEGDTKQIMSILRELVALNTTPSTGQQPNTQTSRITP